MIDQKAQDGFIPRLRRLMQSRPSHAVGYVRVGVVSEQ